jgi:CheY-like chemotaxis protein
MLSVDDNGSGMDSETRLKAFNPFFTTKEKGRGTGLGLSTVHGIVKQVGGAVELFSEPQGGTCVKVYLPRTADAVPLPAEKPLRNNMEPAGGRETILVVEDEEDVRRLVRAALERRGYRVLLASSGTEALEISRREGPIHLLLTDMVMPRMSGPSVASKIKAERPEIRVVFMSGYTDRSLQESSAFADETAALLQKPFTPAVLGARVREALDRKSGEGARTAGS